MNVRGQTSIDFLVGMSVFLITIGVIFAFLPGMFEPFADGSGVGMIVSERTATWLSEDALVVAPTAPGVLNATCTAEFFDAEEDVDGCRFGSDASNLNEVLPVDSRARINVTIESNGISTLHHQDETVELARGQEPTRDAAVVVSNRIVSIRETNHRLVVRVW